MDTLYYNLRKRDRCEKDEDKENNKKQKKDTLGDDKHLEISSINNHIYYYAAVTKKTVLQLNKEIRIVTRDLLISSRKYGTDPPPIYLHINSYGGSVFACLSTIDQIQNNPIPIYSIVEGAAASAATLISVCCDKRFITQHGHMLIHQLSSVFWGKMEEFEDEIKNLKLLMKIIKKIYKDNCKIPQNKLDEILKHDLWWDAKKCKSYSLVDKIIIPKNDKVNVNESEPY